MIRVVLIDDHTLVRHSLGVILKHPENIQVIGEAGTGIEGIALTQQLQPDVVVLDFKLPDISGLEVTTRLMRLEPAPKILLLSADVHTDIIFRLLEAGTMGFLTKSASREELINAIQDVANEKPALMPEIASRLALAKIDAQLSAVFSTLTNKEMEILMLTLRGISSKEIAQRLHISPKTIHSYRSRIFEKLDVENEVALILLALKEGLLMPEEASG